MPNLGGMWAAVARSIEALGKGPSTRALEADVEAALAEHIAELAAAHRDEYVRNAIVQVPGSDDSGRALALLQLTAAHLPPVLMKRIPSGPTAGGDGSFVVVVDQAPADDPAPSRFRSLDLGS